MVNCLKMHYFATKDCFFKRFYKDQLANIHQHFWKEHLEPRTLTKFKGDTSKVNKDNYCSRKSWHFAESLYSGGRNNSVNLTSYICQIIIKLGIFTDLNFQQGWRISTYWFWSKVKKNCWRVYLHYFGMKYNEQGRREQRLLVEKFRATPYLKKICFFAFLLLVYLKKHPMVLHVPFIL